MKNRLSSRLRATERGVEQTRWGHRVHLLKLLRRAEKLLDEWSEPEALAAVLAIAGAKLLRATASRGEGEP
jgi:hypothetical protein